MLLTRSSLVSMPRQHLIKSMSEAITDRCSGASRRTQRGQPRAYRTQTSAAVLALDHILLHRRWGNNACIHRFRSKTTMRCYAAGLAEAHPRSRIGCFESAHPRAETYQPLDHRAQDSMRRSFLADEPNFTPRSCQQAPGPHTGSVDANRNDRNSGSSGTVRRF